MSNGAEAAPRPGRFVIPHFRWWLCGLLFLATVVNYLDRQTFSIATPHLAKEFKFTNTDISRIILAFQIAYLISQTLSGRLIDWLGTKRGFSLTITWWSLAGIGTSLAASLRGFQFWRLLLGLGEAGNWPGAVRAISEWFPKKERAFAVGFFNSGSSIGAIVAPPLVAYLIIHYSWQMAFILTGCCGFVWLLLWLLFFHGPQESPYLGSREREYILAAKQQEEREQPPGEKLGWIDLLRFRQVWGLVLGRVFSDPIWWFYAYWIPKYFEAQRQFTMADIGKYLWIPFLANDLGNFAGGGVSSWLIRRGWSVGAARKTVMTVSALTMPLGIVAVRAEDWHTCLALICIVLFAYTGWASNMLTLPADIAPPHLVASVSGLSGTGGALGGIMFMWVAGPLADRYGFAPDFLITGIMAVIAALMILFVTGPVRHISLEKVKEDAPGSG